VSNQVTNRLWVQTLRIIQQSRNNADNRKHRQWSLSFSTGIKRILEGEIKPAASKAEEGKLQVRYTTIPLAPETKYSVLETDYDSYAVLWSCQGIGPIHAQNAWVMTRERIPAGEVLQKVRLMLNYVNYRISIEMIEKVIWDIAWFPNWLIRTNLRKAIKILCAEIDLGSADRVIPWRAGLLIPLYLHCYDNAIISIAGIRCSRQVQDIEDVLRENGSGGLRLHGCPIGGSHCGAGAKAAE
jgi:hypothetical protein